MALITNTDVKNYLSITGTDYDTIITDYIAKATNQLLDMIGQNIEATTLDVYFKGDGKAEYLIPYHPVTLVNTLSYRVSVLDDWTVIDSDDYKLFERDGCYWIYHSSFAKGYQYKTNITYGYSTIPEAIKMIAIEMTVDKLLDSNITDSNNGFRHGLISRAEAVNGFTGTTAFKTSDYEYRLGKYKVLLK